MTQDSVPTERWVGASCHFYKDDVPAEQERRAVDRSVGTVSLEKAVKAKIPGP